MFTKTVHADLSGMRSVREQEPLPFRPGDGFWARDRETDMLAGKGRHEANLLSAFALAIVGALAAGLPMALVIIWACS